MPVHNHKSVSVEYSGKIVPWKVLMKHILLQYITIDGEKHIEKTPPGQEIYLDKVT
jgi:hypothetical protein